MICRAMQSSTVVGSIDLIPIVIPPFTSFSQNFVNVNKNAEDKNFLHAGTTTSREFEDSNEDQNASSPLLVASGAAC